MGLLIARPPIFTTSRLLDLHNCDLRQWLRHSRHHDHQSTGPITWDFCFFLWLSGRDCLPCSSGPSCWAAWLYPDHSSGYPACPPNSCWAAWLYPDILSGCPARPPNNCHEGSWKHSEALITHEWGLRGTDYPTSGASK